MQISLDTSDGEAYYYTRVVSRSSTNTEDYVKFASSFAQMCMDKNAADGSRGLSGICRIFFNKFYSCDDTVTTFYDTAGEI